MYSFNIPHTDIKMNISTESQNLDDKGRQNDNNSYSIDFNRKIIQLIIEKKQNINYYWTSASKLYNYINDDPLLDWLQLHGKRHGYKTDKEIDYQEYLETISDDNNKISFEEFVNKNYEYNFMKYILEQGVQYENYVYKILKNKYGEQIVDVDGDFNFQKFEYDKKLEKTQSLILNNTPIIYQGLVCDPDTKTFGFPDLIVREDYLSHFTSIPVNDTETPKQYYNYYIIDIKYHTLEYKKDSNCLIANPSQQQYISQMYLYTKGLRHLIHPSALKSNLLEHKSYIIGRNWNDNVNTSVGCIHFKLYDKTLEKIKKGLEWYKELKYKGYYWDPLNRKIYELYPNMKNDKDNNWRKSKQIIAEKLGEITMIWNCGTNIRLNAHKSGVYTWKTPDFNILKYTNETDTTKLINDIIKINNQSIRLYDYDKTVLLDRDSNCPRKWMSEDSLSIVDKNNIVMDGFIDIENTFDIRSIDTPKQDSIIYMLGLYYNENIITSRTKKYKDAMKHKTFCLKNLDKIQEKEMIEEFLLYLKSFNCEKHITWRLYHYSGVEKYTLNKLMEQYKILPETYGITIQWIDLCDILIKYKFVFKNCFDYSVKSINKVLNQLGYIPDECIYKNSLIKNGLDSIIALYKCDENSKLNNIELNKSILMEDIIYYNMIDCMSLYYLRKFLQETVLF